MKDIQTAPGLVRFSFDEAWRAGSRLVSRCREEEAPVTIGIWLGSQRVFHCALNGTSADNDAWLERKANTVRHFGCSSLEAQERFGHLGNDFFSVFALARTKFALAGGAVPIVVQGSVVGVIGVSGLESAEDHALAVWALQEEVLRGLA